MAPMVEVDWAAAVSEGDAVAMVAGVAEGTVGRGREADGLESNAVGGGGEVEEVGKAAEEVGGEEAGRGGGGKGGGGGGCGAAGAIG